MSFQDLKRMIPALVGGAAVATLISLLVGGGNGGAPTQSRVPGEYLYLDSDRVSAYLGQLNVGLSPTEERTLTRTSEAQAQVGAGGVTLGGSRQEQNFVRTVVTPDAADRFYDLRNRLDRIGRFKALNADADLRAALSGTERPTTHPR